MAAVALELIRYALNALEAVKRGQISTRNTVLLSNCLAPCAQLIIAQQTELGFVFVTY